MEGKYLPLLDCERDFICYHHQLGMNCREILEVLHQTVSADGSEFKGSFAQSLRIHKILEKIMCWAVKTDSDNPGGRARSGRPTAVCGLQNDQEHSGEEQIGFDGQQGSRDDVAESPRKV